MLGIPLPEVLIAFGQHMPFQIRKPPLQILEELHTRFVVVGIHVERHALGQSVPQQSDVCLCERCGRWNSHRLMSCRQHSPAIRRALGNPQLIPLLQSLDHRFVIHPHVRAPWKAESGLLLLPHISPLYTQQPPIYIPIRNQQRRRVIKSLPPAPTRHRPIDARQSAPLHHPRVNLPLVIQKMRRHLINNRLPHKRFEVFQIQFPLRLSSRRPSHCVSPRARRVSVVCTMPVLLIYPFHRLLESDIFISHHQVDHIPTHPASKAFKPISLESQARVPVVMEWAERLMAPHLYSQLLGHILYRRSPDIIQPFFIDFVDGWLHFDFVFLCRDSG